MASRLPVTCFAALALAATIVACSTKAGAPLPPEPATMLRTIAGASKIQHVVIVIQENRSFDNFFATFPRADGAKSGKAAAMTKDEQAYCRSNGMTVIAKPTSVPLKETDLFGSGFGKTGHFDQNTDLDHIHSGYLTELDDGKMDGWDLTGTSANGSGLPVCTYGYQYVNPADIAPYWEIAKEYVLADHTFQTQGSSSFTAHQDLIAGGTQINADSAIINNPSYFPWGCDAERSVKTDLIKRNGHVYVDQGPFPCLTYATLRDLLDAKGVSWKFYAMPVNIHCLHGNTAGGAYSAFDAIKAVRYGKEWSSNVTRNSTVFFTDVEKRELPAVSWITPDGSNSDHPAEYAHSACATPKPDAPPEDKGPAWVASIVNAVGRSPYWKTTAIVVLWDDWGGFFDHVTPPARNWQGGVGFRVPMLIVSPYVKAHVDHTVYQFGSVLRFVEDTWHLGTLGRNDEHSASIVNAFDFTMAPRTFHVIPSDESPAYFIGQKPSGLPADSE